MGAARHLRRPHVSDFSIIHAAKGSDPCGMID
jgi:hypothetical protein